MLTVVCNKHIPHPLSLWHYISEAKQKKVVICAVLTHAYRIYVCYFFITSSRDLHAHFIFYCECGVWYKSKIAGKTQEKTFKTAIMPGISDEIQNDFDLLFGFNLINFSAAPIGGPCFRPNCSCWCSQFSRILRRRGTAQRFAQINLHLKRIELKIHVHFRSSKRKKCVRMKRLIKHAPLTYAAIRTMLCNISIIYDLRKLSRSDIWWYRRRYTLLYITPCETFRLA